MAPFKIDSNQIQLGTINPNSPFGNPRTCPTHIEVDGYGRVPVSVFTQSWLGGASQVVPDVHERVLYTRPTRPGDMVHPRQPVSTKTVLWALVGASVGAGLVALGCALASPAVAALGALAWVVSFGAAASELEQAPRVGVQEYA